MIDNLLMREYVEGNIEKDVVFVQEFVETTLPETGRTRNKWFVFILYEELPIFPNSKI